MEDIDTVYSGLDKCRKCDCDDCTLFNASKAPWDCPAKDQLIDDALELLKEQQERIRVLELALDIAMKKGIVVKT